MEQSSKKNFCDSLESKHKNVEVAYSIGIYVGGLVTKRVWAWFTNKL